jgi:hypothetical protein
MRWLTALLVSILAAASPPAVAQVIVYEEIVEEEVVYFPDSATGSFAADPAGDSGNYRLVDVAPAAVPKGIAAFGPFRVLDSSHAALVDVTDERSPGAFNAMLGAYPGIAVLQMIDCPGTEDDQANLRLGRMIRARGIATSVPAGGSVRSGAVELFLAGTQRSADRSAEFAVHAWMDQDGLEPADYAANSPENRTYLDYYQAMGMSAAEAQAFYAMTNSVPNAQARWLSAADMGRWVHLDRAVVAAAPVRAEALAGAPMLAASLDLKPRLH